MKFYLWTIYKRGTSKDYPSNFVARKFSVASGASVLTEEAIVTVNLELLRNELRRRGYVQMMRAADDHESIIETWI